MKFYDGKIRPKEDSVNWTDEEIDRICLNCGEKFGRHYGYDCPEQI